MRNGERVQAIEIACDICSGDDQSWSGTEKLLAAQFLQVLNDCEIYRRHIDLADRAREAAT